MPGLVPERRRERLAERDPGVLDGVVGVDVEVPRRPHDEVEARVRAELAEHVVEEGQSRRDLDATDAVEVEVDGDVALGRLAVPLAVAAGRRRLAAGSLCHRYSLARRRRRGRDGRPVSRRLRRGPRGRRRSPRGLPIVTRRWPASRGQPDRSRTRTERATRPSQTSWASWSPVENSMKFASDGDGRRARARRGRRAPVPARRRGAPPARPSPPVNCEGERSPPPASAASTWYGSAAGEQRLDDLGRAERVAETERGERPRLREGPEHDEVGVLADELERGTPGELAVGLVDDDEPGGAPEDRLDRLVGLDEPRRVVRRAQGRRRRARPRRTSPRPRAPARARRDRRGSRGCAHPRRWPSRSAGRCGRGGRRSARTARSCAPARRRRGGGTGSPRSSRWRRRPGRRRGRAGRRWRPAARWPAGRGSG